MKFSRQWAMPNKDTFEVRPIHAFVSRWLRAAGGVSVDPFARNSLLADYRNDLNPQTKAQHHLDAVDFLNLMKKEGVRAGCVIVDPPYSPRQIKECYDAIGLKMRQVDAMRAKYLKNLKEAIDGIMEPNGVVLTFGWNSVGMGTKLGYELHEIMLVCHGGDHNDTICLAERKL